jgi:hypothetical protein
MTKERLDAISRIMAVLRSVEREKDKWPQRTVDTDQRNWLWCEEVAYNLFIEAEEKLEEALVVLSKGENRVEGEE